MVKTIPGIRLNSDPGFPPAADKENPGLRIFQVEKWKNDISEMIIHDHETELINILLCPTVN